MTFIRIFDKWYVSMENRGGVQADAQGRVTLVFEGIEAGAVVRVGGQLRRVEGACVSLRADEGAFALTVLLPDGSAQEAENLVVHRGCLLPSGFCRDDLLLEIASRLQQLEAAEREDRQELQYINDKRKGRYFLGGTKQ